MESQMQNYRLWTLTLGFWESWKDTPGQIYAPKYHLQEPLGKWDSRREKKVGTPSKRVHSHPLGDGVARKKAGTVGSGAGPDRGWKEAR